MESLVHRTAKAQKWGKRAVGFGVTGLIFAYLNYSAASGAPIWLDIAVAVGFGLHLSVRTFIEVRGQREGAAAAFSSAYFTQLLVLAYGVILYLPGGLVGPYYPLVYVVLMMAAGLGTPRAALSVAFWAGVMELLLRATLHDETSLVMALPRLSFLGAIAALHQLFFRAEIARVRRLGKAQVHGELERIEKAARAFRLSGGTTLGSEQGAEASEHAAVGEVQKSAEFALRLLTHSLKLNSATLLLLDQNQQLRVLESVSPCSINKGPYSAASGAFNIALTRLEAVEVQGRRASHHLPFFEQAFPIGVVRIVPVSTESSAKALLVLTRAEAVAFDSTSTELVFEAASYLMRAIQNERVYTALERASSEQAKLYRAASALGTARSEADVIEVGVESAREMSAFDFAAVTLFHKQQGSHEICAVSGEGAEQLVGRSFRQNAGLVSMSIANRQALPFRGHYEPSRQLVFARGYEPPKLPSLLVLPLVVHEKPLGTLVLGSKKPGAFQKSLRPALEVLASHMAVSLSSARMLQRLEEQATTDGMTGLLNKRTLILEAEKKVKSAARFKKSLSLLVTDIDFFKKVNDNYGHDVGDLVIKGLGDLLRRVKRDTDIVGRFGGEEFVIVCEQTDAEGALQLAERIRRELENTTFQTELGPLSVTGSVGVATFPAAGKDYETLFKACDEALYVSKRSGRNQVHAWSAQLKSNAKAG